MDEKAYIQEIIQKARKAQAKIETFNQKQVDRAVRAVAKVVYDNAEELARMAVDETGMGVYEDKVLKNKGKARVIWNNLKDKKSVDIIDYDEKTKVYLVAKPIGVIALVTPTTNPIVTPMCNIMFALKGRNAAVIAPHPRAKGCTAYTVELIKKELVKLGIDEDIVQVIKEPSIELTNEVMRQADTVVATGGMGMVKAAYSSGKPSLGVGQGNVQVVLDRDIDIVDAVKKIIVGRAFDNGIICSGEQTVIAPKDTYDDIIKAFLDNGCYYLDDQSKIDRIREVMYPGGGIISRDVVGQSPYTVAKMAGVDIPENTKVLLLKAKGAGKEDVLCKEKMCPIMATFMYDTFEEGVDIARVNLEYEGMGHSAAIHSNDRKHIEYAGVKLHVSRVIINQTASTSIGGSFFNGFAPSTTLGCGTWGNNSISENLDYKHLINISRIGLLNTDAVQPSDEEIWAEI
ncbi:MAG: aldehyde dehydrogenase family protein [Spirochaetales bacterium]|nr:aldehyde dehydrogenase family protein [Spirochaetales bacterium]